MTTRSLQPLDLSFQIKHKINKLDSLLPIANTRANPSGLAVCTLPCGLKRHNVVECRSSLHQCQQVSLRPMCSHVSANKSASG